MWNDLDAYRVSRSWDDVRTWLENLDNLLWSYGTFSATIVEMPVASFASVNIGSPSGKEGRRSQLADVKMRFGFNCSYTSD